MKLDLSYAKKAIASLPGKQRFILILLGVAVAVGGTLPAFLTASCFTRQQTPAEIKALESLRLQTRRGQLPADEVVARIESEFPRTKAAALARMVRARIKIRDNDYAGRRNVTRYETDSGLHLVGRPRAFHAWQCVGTNGTGRGGAGGL